MVATKRDDGELFQHLTTPELLVVQSLFLACCKKVEGCLEWQGIRTVSDPRYSDGYGEIWRKTEGNEVRLRAHRVAYLLFVGPIEDGLEVCHRCDNPICCQPIHLFLGTHKENMQDALSKGRLMPPVPRPGSRNNLAKLTEEEVIEMREKYPALSIPVLARLYGVSRSQVQRIVTRKVWTHV